LRLFFWTDLGIEATYPLPHPFFSKNVILEELGREFAQECDSMGVGFAGDTGRIRKVLENNELRMKATGRRA
jgi:hypothetical protein